MNIFPFQLSAYSHLEIERDWSWEGWLEAEVWLRKDRDLSQIFFFGGGVCLESGRPRRIWETINMLKTSTLRVFWPRESITLVEVSYASSARPSENRIPQRTTPWFLRSKQLLWILVFFPQKITSASKWCVWLHQTNGLFLLTFPPLLLHVISRFLQQLVVHLRRMCAWFW